MAEKKQKMLQFRQIDGLKDTRTLQGLLSTVLSTTHTTIGERSEPVVADDPEEDVQRCINLFSEFSGMLFGMLIEYVAGTDKQAVTVDPNQKQIQPEQVKPPKAGDKRREFVDGVVYFGVKDNHMVLLQSQALRDRHLENHLGWLLINKADKLQDGELLGMRRELTPDAQKEFEHVRSVELGQGMITPPDSKDEASERTAAKHTTDEVQSFEIADFSKGILRELIGEDWQKKIFTEEYEDLDSLRVTVKVQKVNGPQKPGNGAERMMGALTTQLRHTHEEDLRVITKHGRMDGDKLFLSEKRPIECSHGVPIPHSVFLEMRNWLTEKDEEGILPSG